MICEPYKLKSFIYFSFLVSMSYKLYNSYRLHKLYKYALMIVAMSTMSANLYSVVGELYEENWPNSDEFRTRSQVLIKLLIIVELAAVRY